MGNQLFQSAREAVKNAVKGKHDSASEHNNTHDYSSEVDSNSMSVAKNALSSAYANSTEAEKVQLRELQEELFNSQQER
ncbi:DUF3813 domain-containing protein [Sutcliffiella horikoshii]|uniref:DUF3813 domain-containing protein n=1 Tax=Sutcliffiella horikoshii TaxID=79883 RepID=UPI001F3B4084|nr:DUF3813 domain-containing protein [Sutcliffiella horikoshii]MCG1020085.1 DUF3813 domain-containing protein [Sutcliffiella horikoshii]